MIKRKIIEYIERDIDKPEISLITWPRQVGKTTIMKSIKRKLDDQDKKTLFLSLDFESDKSFFESQESLVNRIKLEFWNEKGFVFLDEIQRKENAWLFLKWIFDMDLPHKFIVSGSWSLELKENIHESLAGRKKIFEVWPINLEEFINYKTDYKYVDKIWDFCVIEKSKAENLLKEYLCFWGFPRVILEDVLDDKLSIINEIYSSYIERDIRYLLKTDRIDAFSMMIKILANNNWWLINYTNIAQKVWVSVPTLKNYLRYSEKTFCTYFVYPFVWHKAKELVKMPVSYFTDIWFRNFAVWDFKNIESESRLWFDFQNLVWNILKEKISISSKKLNYRRTVDGWEVDFIVDSGNWIIPFEVKYSNFSTIKISKSMRSFIDKYKPKEFYIVNNNLRKEEIVWDKWSTIIKYITIFDLFQKIL